jgi:mono/diheme cytochrome c family protein
VAVEARPLATEPDTTSEQDVITEGRKIFHGQGLCYACHGGRLQGGPVAPPLAGPKRDPRDTSFAFILKVVRAGEPHTPMVANQGGIDAGQMVQVANYVWAVSNAKSVP